MPAFRANANSAKNGHDAYSLSSSSEDSTQQLVPARVTTFLKEKRKERKSLAPKQSCYWSGSDDEDSPSYKKSRTARQSILEHLPARNDKKSSDNGLARLPSFKNKKKNQKSLASKLLQEKDTSPFGSYTIPKKKSNTSKHTIDTTLPSSSEDDDEFATSHDLRSTKLTKKTNLIASAAITKQTRHQKPSPRIGRKSSKHITANTTTERRPKSSFSSTSRKPASPSQRVNPVAYAALEENKPRRTTIDTSMPSSDEDDDDELLRTPIFSSDTTSNQQESKQMRAFEYDADHEDEPFPYASPKDAKKSRRQSIRPTTKSPNNHTRSRMIRSIQKQRTNKLSPKSPSCKSSSKQRQYFLSDGSSSEDYTYRPKKKNVAATQWSTDCEVDSPSQSPSPRVPVPKKQNPHDNLDFSSHDECIISERSTKKKRPRQVCASPSKKNMNKQPRNKYGRREARTYNFDEESISL